MNPDKHIWFTPVYWRQQDKEPLRFDFYRINKCGEILSLLSKRRLKPNSELGYKYVSLKHPKTYNPKNKNPLKPKKYRIHKLVACTFIFNPDRYVYNVVDHKDSNKVNNCIDNLDWVTPSENTRRAFNKDKKKHIEVVKIKKKQLPLFPDETK